MLKGLLFAWKQTSSYSEDIRAVKKQNRKKDGEVVVQSAGDRAEKQKVPSSSPGLEQT